MPVNELGATNLNPPTENLVSDATGDSMAALKILMDAVNSERQAIWARHASMLVSNSLIIAVMNGPVERVAHILMPSVGIIICCLWLAMTLRGWSYLQEHMRAATNLNPQPQINPLRLPPNAPNRGIIWDTMSISTVILIFLFALIYSSKLADAFGYYFPVIS